MGAWGVKATESDYGLDLLALIETRVLKEQNFERFCLSEIMEMLKGHILAQIRYSNRGASPEEMDFYIEESFPYDYDDAVILVSELLADYLSLGKIVLEIYERGMEKPLIKEITNVIFTPGDLKEVMADLQAVLNPDRPLYSAWEESKSFQEWQSHILALLECLKDAEAKSGSEASRD